MGEVIDLNERRQRKEPTKEVGPAQRLTFEEVAAKNREVQERLRKERAQANQQTLRSYRIK